MNARIINDAKKQTQPLVLGGRSYDINFSLNAIEAIQERYGGLEKMSDEIAQISELKWIIAMLVNEAVDEHNDNFAQTDPWNHVTEKYVGRKVDVANLGEVKSSIFSAFGKSMPQPQEAIGEVDDELMGELDGIEDTETKNPTAEQQ